MAKDLDAWTKPCYTIGIVAEIVSLHPQTLRRYEEIGLLLPARKAGRRLYSPSDVDRVQQIARLSGELGLNMAGVEVIMRLNDRIRELQSQVDVLRAQRIELEAQISALRGQLHAFGA